MRFDGSCRATLLMDAVVLAALSAFLFGAMTVALRFGLASGGVSPEVGTASPCCRRSL